MTVAEIMEGVKGLKVLELAELVKALEEEFGVSAMPVAVAGAAGGAAAPAEAEQTEFDVELTSAGSSKIGVIKVVRAITGLGLKEAKEKVDGAPSIIKEAASKEEAESIKAQLEEAGAQVTLK
jgi:large subunit ribosomal protein L7/L12